MKDTERLPRRTSYWLVEKDGSRGKEILTLQPSLGQDTLPVFSFREEAEMFLCLRGSRDGLQDGWRIRETTPGELLSLFYTLLGGITHVTLDPIPENSFLDTSGLLSITRKDFVARLRSLVDRCTVVGIGGSRPPGPGRHRPTQKIG